MKKAFLVSFSPMTRVVVDVQEELTTEDNENIMYAAIEKMSKNIEFYICPDNLESIEEDKECPHVD